MKKLLLAAAAALFSCAAAAQSVNQSGSVTPGHLPVWISSGVIGDGGAATSPSTMRPITGLGIVNNSDNGFCIYTAPIASAGYQRMCFGVNQNANAQISIQNFGTATAQGIGFLVNGTPAALPTVQVPGTVGHAVCYQTTSGQLNDCGVAPVSSLIVGTTAITGGTSNGILFNSAGVLGNTGSANAAVLATDNSGNPSLTQTPSLGSVGVVGGQVTLLGLTSGSVAIRVAAAAGTSTVFQLPNTNGTNTFALQTDGSGNTSWVTLAATGGGTGNASYAIGDLLQANTTTSLQRLAAVATGNALISGGVGTVSSWGKIGLTTHVSGLLPFANGGTNANLTADNGAIPYSTASAFALLAHNATAGLPLLSGASAAPTWAAVTYTPSGTSGGLAYFSAVNVMASSAALAANVPIVGGGAGVAPSTPGTTPPTISSTGVVTIPNATAATSGTTGALIVTGGVGVAGNSFYTGTFTVNASGTAINSWSGIINNILIQYQGLPAGNTAVTFDSAAQVNQFGMRRMNGTFASPSALSANDSIALFQFYGHDGTAFTLQGANMGAAANENWSNTAHGTRITFLTTPNGSTSAAEAMRIQASGGLSVGNTTDDGIGSIRANTTINAVGSYRVNGKLAWSATQPTISSGFCTSPTIDSSSNGTASIIINIGTGCAASTGVLGMPTASNGWVCAFQNITNPNSNVIGQTASSTTSVSVTNYSRTTGVASNWTASDTVRAMCAAS